MFRGRKPLYNVPPSQQNSLNYAKYCCLLMTILMGIALIVLTIIWIVQLGKINKRAKEVRCATAILISDSVKGVN